MYNGTEIIRLTPQAPTDSNCPVSALPAGAGAPEIEVTPEMIEAGVRALWASGAIEYPSVADRDLVTHLYRQMAAANLP
jgi:hypothetical protein